MSVLNSRKESNPEVAVRQMLSLKKCKATLHMLLISFFGLIGCASSPFNQESLKFDELVIRNLEYGDIHNFEIKLVKSNRVFACGSILANVFCSVKIPVREYLGEPIVLSWEEGQRKITYGPFLPSPDVPDLTSTYAVVLTIRHGSEFDFSFIQK